MIQRVQTVYLLIVAVLMICLLCLSISSALLNNWILLAIAGVTAGIAVLAIFLYKNRKAQIKVCQSVLLFLVAYYIAFAISNLGVLFELPDQLGAVYPVVFPFIAMIFTFLAIGGIRKDEKLIRSADRIR